MFDVLASPRKSGPVFSFSCLSCCLRNSRWSERGQGRKTASGAFELNNGIESGLCGLQLHNRVGLADGWAENRGGAYRWARYYNSLTGRFLSRDPEAGKPADPKTLHKYLYASGDPVNRLDAKGTDDEVDESLLTTNVNRVAQSLGKTGKAVRCAIHAIKAELSGVIEGNPDVLIDPTNGNVYLPISLEFVGCLYDYFPED